MAAAPAAAAAQMAQALHAHDNLKRSTEIPLFFGSKDRDSISARLLIDRIEAAARIANWNEERRRQELYMILRGKALIWWASLEDTNIDRDNWNAVKTEFLQVYEPKYTARTTCANLHELIQKPGEKALDYYLRIHDVYRRFSETKPAAIGEVAGDLAGVDAAEARRFKAEGIRDAERFFKHQLFLAGLRDDLRTKVMEANKATLHESSKLASEIETMNDRDRGQRVNAVGLTNTEEPEEEREDSLREVVLDEEELAAVNALRMRNGRPPFRSGFRRSGPPSSNGNGKKTVICRYCKKPGHFQKECRTRQRANGAMVDANGKPYTRGVNSTERSPADETPAPTSGLGAPKVSSVEAAHHQINALNW